MTEPEPQNLSDIIEIVNEFQYDEIVDNYRECNHGIKVLRLSALIDLIKRKIEEDNRQEIRNEIINFNMVFGELKDPNGLIIHPDLIELIHYAIRHALQGLAGDLLK